MAVYLEGLAVMLVVLGQVWLLREMFLMLIKWVGIALSLELHWEQPLVLPLEYIQHVRIILILGRERGISLGN